MGRAAATALSAVGDLDSLPVLPMVVARLLALDAKSEDYFDEVIELVGAEPTYAARLLAAANTVEARGRSPIRTLRDAVVRLGARRVSGLVVSLSVVRVFVPRTEWERSLWVHAIRVACASRCLTQLSRDRELDPEQAYLAGLLHDVGRFLLFDTNSESLRQVDESEWDDISELAATEKQLLGFDHAELGAMACKHWALPHEIERIVRRHHSPRIGTLLSGTLGQIGELVRAGDLLMASSLRSTAPTLTEATDEELQARLTSVLPQWYPALTPRLLERVRGLEVDVETTTKTMGL